MITADILTSYITTASLILNNNETPEENKYEKYKLTTEVKDDAINH